MSDTLNLCNLDRREVVKFLLITHLGWNSMQNFKYIFDYLTVGFDSSL
jgi:hypothetical protein